MKNIRLENLSDYESLNKRKLVTVLKNYIYFEGMARNGDMTALCLSLDIEEALKYLTEEERICIEEYYIIGETSLREIGRKIDRKHDTVQVRIDNGLKKLLYFLKTGDNEFKNMEVKTEYRKGN